MYRILFMCANGNYMVWTDGLTDAEFESIDRAMSEWKLSGMEGRDAFVINSKKERVRHIPASGKITPAPSPSITPAILAAEPVAHPYVIMSEGLNGLSDKLFDDESFDTIGHAAEYWEKHGRGSAYIVNIYAGSLSGSGQRVINLPKKNSADCKYTPAQAAPGKFLVLIKTEKGFLYDYDNNGYPTVFIDSHAADNRAQAIVDKSKGYLEATVIDISDDKIQWIKH